MSIATMSEHLSIPMLFKRDAVLGPIPYIFFISNGAKNFDSKPGFTTVNPSGLSKSDAILATSLEVAKPAEDGKFVSDLIRLRMVLTSA
tara:strand:+ start:602 stop:868 length:267 start_codon:yes stop_codon:yes gene_type:complete